MLVIAGVEFQPEPGPPGYTPLCCLAARPAPPAHRRTTLVLQPSGSRQQR